MYTWRYSQRNLTCTRPCNVSFASSSTYISMGCNLKRQQKNIGPHTHTHTYEEIVLVSWPSNCQRPCTLAFQCQPGMRSPFLSLFKALPLRNLQTKKLSPINLQLYCCYCMPSKKECRLTKLLCPVVLPWERQLCLFPDANAHEYELPTDDKFALFAFLISTACCNGRCRQKTKLTKTSS